VYNSTKTSDSIYPLLIFPTEMIFTGIVVDDSGDYKLKVRVVSTGENIINNLTVSALFADPELIRQSMTPAPPIS